MAVLEAVALFGVLFIVLLVLGGIMKGAEAIYFRVKSGRERTGAPIPQRPGLVRCLIGLLL